MNRMLLGAGTLSGAAIAAHIVLGSDVHAELLDAVQPPILRTFSSVTWQAVTAMLAINTAALFTAALRSDMAQPLALIVACQYGAWAGLFLFYAMAYLDSPFDTPQWIAFLLIALLAWVGGWRKWPIPEASTRPPT